MLYETSELSLNLLGVFLKACKNFKWIGLEYVQTQAEIITQENSSKKYSFLHFVQDQEFEQFDQFFNIFLRKRNKTRYQIEPKNLKNNVKFRKNLEWNLTIFFAQNYSAMFFVERGQFTLQMNFLQKTSIFRFFSILWKRKLIFSLKKRLVQFKIKKFEKKQMNWN